jgi:hypothetical protein
MSARTVPPHPPAAAEDVVATARSKATASTVSAEARVLSAQVIAPPPGPTAADGAAITDRMIAALASASPPSASRTMGWGLPTFRSIDRRSAAALRMAQIQMWRQKHWSAPYYWAAVKYRVSGSEFTLLVLVGVRVDRPLRRAPCADVMPGRHAGVLMIPPLHSAVIVPSWAFAITSPLPVLTSPRSLVVPITQDQARRIV